MPNTLAFEEFLKTLQTTNRCLGFFVDWNKCLRHRDSISICLNHLNFLLGKSRDEMRG